MSVEVIEGRILVSGHAAVEDAEPLLTALLAHPDYPIDVSGLSRAHLAVVQLFYAAKRSLVGRPEDGVLRYFALMGVIAGD